MACFAWIGIAVVALFVLWVIRTLVGIHLAASRNIAPIIELGLSHQQTRAFLWIVRANERELQLTLSRAAQISLATYLKRVDDNACKHIADGKLSVFDASRGWLDWVTDQKIAAMERRDAELAAAAKTTKDEAG